MPPSSTKKHCAVFLLAILFLLPAPSLAASTVFYAPAGQVSAMVICEQSGFARTYSIFTNGVARMHYDDTTKTLDNLKFALLMSSFVSSSPTFAQEFASSRKGGNDEFAFIQSDPMKFENNKATIKGQLLINGIRKDASFEGSLNKFGRLSKTADLYDDGTQTLGFSMHTTFKRSDFALGSSDTSPFNDDAILMLDIVAK